MKYFIASDIHGSASWCKKMIDMFNSERADRLVLLGDLLYHGPRNDLPDDYNPKKVIEMLNALKNKIICVRGNCDTEVDQMVLSFPIMADYALIELNSDSPITIYATHGHHYNEENPLPVSRGNILLCGHTHVPCCHTHEDFVYMNPGSVAIPKENSAHSVIIYEDGGFTWKNIEDAQPYLEWNVLNMLEDDPQDIPEDDEIWV